MANEEKNIGESLLSLSPKLKLLFLIRDRSVTTPKIDDYAVTKKKLAPNIIPDIIDEVMSNIRGQYDTQELFDNVFRDLLQEIETFRQEIDRLQEEINQLSNQPNQPSQPSQPGQPNQPNQPSQPDKPDQPNQPDQTDHPTQEPNVSMPEHIFLTHEEYDALDSYVKDAIYFILGGAEDEPDDNQGDDNQDQGIWVLGDKLPMILSDNVFTLGNVLPIILS